MIGLSLSLCIKDLCEGKVKLQDVDKIIAGTFCNSDHDWDYLIERYCETYWNKYPDKARAFVTSLLIEGQIEQPRVDYVKNNTEWCVPSISGGHWVESESDTKEI